MVGRKTGFARVSSLVGAFLACRAPVQYRAVPSPMDSLPRADWLAAEPAICGEISGRVLDATTGRPFKDVYVTVDSLPRGVSTDSLGQFRFVVRPNMLVTPSLTPLTLLRIRRIGSMDVAVSLRPSLAYVIEVTLAPMYMHVDHISEVRLKDPGACERSR